MTLSLAMLPCLGMAECRQTPPIAVNGYCAVKATELIDLTDSGLRRLTPKNQGAVLAGDDNWTKLCALGDRSNSLGPR